MSIDEKGIAVGTVLKLILAVLIASAFISLTTLGALGDAMQDSVGSITDQSDFTAEIENKEQFSQLAAFVRDRSDSCDRVEKRNSGESISQYGGPHYDFSGEGYPKLSHVDHLGQRPDCIAAKGNMLTREATLPDSNFQPGILSRERFEIEKSFKLDKSGSGLGNSEYWIDYKINSISAKGPAKMIYNTPYSEEAENSKFTGSDENYVILFKNSSVARARSSNVIQNAPSGYESYNNRVWANVNGKNTQPYPVGWSESWVQEEDFKLRLCEGDKGYIQRNVGVPSNNGVTSRSLGGAQEDYYPMIVIEETEKMNCGEALYPQVDNSNIYGRLYFKVDDVSVADDYSPDNIRQYEKRSNEGDGDIMIQEYKGADLDNNCIGDNSNYEGLLHQINIDEFEEGGSIAQECITGTYAENFLEYIKDGGSVPESVGGPGGPINSKFLKKGDKWYECANSNTVPTEDSEDANYICKTDSNGNYYWTQIEN